MTIVSRSIPERFRDQIAAMPECAYGVNRVTVILDDGTKFDDVLVAWGEEIIKVIIFIILIMLHVFFGAEFGGMKSP